MTRRIPGQRSEGEAFQVENNKCKGPEVGASLVCSGNGKKAMWLEHKLMGAGVGLGNV